MSTAEALMADAPIELKTPVAEPAPTMSQNQSLRDCVEQAMDNYFKHLDGQPANEVYNLVMAEVEAPMLEDRHEVHPPQPNQGGQCIGP